MARTRITNVAEMEPPQPEGLSGPRAQWAGEPPAPGQPSYAALTPPSIPAAKEAPQAAARRQLRISRFSSERWRMASSLLLSLLIHGSLLSLTFGVSGLGLPGLRFPWQERRIEAPELRVVLVPAPLTPAEPAIKSFARPAQQASIEPPVAGGRAPTPRRRPRRPCGVAPSRSSRWPSQRQRSRQNETPWPLPPQQRRPCALVRPVAQCPQKSPSRQRST